MFSNVRKDNRIHIHQASIFSICLTMALLFTPLGSNAQSVKSAATGATDKIIMGYWENWGTYHGYPMPGSTKSNEQMRGQLTGLNAVAYAFFEVATDGSIMFSDTWADLTGKNPNDLSFCAALPQSCPKFKPEAGGIGSFDAFLKASAKHIVVVGGATHDDALEAAMDKPKQFVQSLTLLRQNFPGIDWLDLDYEPVNGIPAAYVPKFIALVEAIRTEFPDLTLSYTLIANSRNIEAVGKDNWALLSAQLDHFGVMGYDLWGAFDPDRKTGLQSTLYTASTDPNAFSVDRAVRTLIAMGVPSTKILLGMPMYGRAVGGVTQAGLDQPFTQSYRGNLDDPNCNLALGSGKTMCGGFFSYKDLILQKLRQVPVTVNNVVSGVMSNDLSKNMFVSYDNEVSARQKALYAQKNNLGGVFFWSLRSDVEVMNEKSILSAVAKVFGVDPYQPARISKAKLFSYWDGNVNAAIPDMKFDGLFVAEAHMSGYEKTAYVCGNCETWGSPSYKSWNKWVKEQKSHVLISYGGTDAGFRSLIYNATEAELSDIAGNLAANVGKHYWNGLELDIENWWSASKAQNLKFATNLATMVKTLRTSLDNGPPSTRGQPIVVTVNYNAAGWLPTPGNDTYTGTMKPFFADAEAMQAVQQINVMSYNLPAPKGYAYFYQDTASITAMLSSFVGLGVPSEKIMFGIQPQECTGCPVTPSAVVESLGKFLYKNDYGGMFLFSIGDPAMGNADPTEYLNAMKKGLSITD